MYLYCVFITYMPPRILDKKQKLLFKRKLSEGTINVVVATHWSKYGIVGYVK